MSGATYIIASNRPWTRELAPSLSKQLGAKFLEVSSPSELTLDFLEEHQPRYVFVPFWSWIIPPEIHTRFTCVVFHMTDLPFGRGGSPLQNLIARGIYSTKICALKVNEKIDAGDVYLRRDLSLDGSAREIYIRATAVIAGMIKEIITKNPIPEPQSGEIVSFKRRKPEDGNLAPLESLVKVFDYIRMLDAEGYPPAFLETDNLRLEFGEARQKGDHIEARVIIRKRS